MQYNEWMENIYQAKGSTLVEQYEDVGRIFREAINASVEKIGKSRAKLLRRRRLVAERAWENLKDQSECREFVLLFSAWCKGAMITVQQGMWLMADNLSGCQTLTVRYASGVALLHTEEEFRDSNHMELHMTSPHTISFSDNGEMSKTLVYNNLFPGAGLYGWKSGMLVAVDSIFLKENDIENVEKPVLANVIAWMIWRMKPELADPDEIVTRLSKMGTLIDGYVINVVRSVGESIQGYKLILARDESKIVRLGEKQGDYLKQVNIIDPDEVEMKWALPPRNIWKGGWKYFRDRLAKLGNNVARYGDYTKFDMNNNIVETIHYTVQEKIFGELASDYVSPDLGAVCVGIIDINVGTSVSCKINDQKPLKVIEYLDKLKQYEGN